MKENDQNTDTEKKVKPKKSFLFRLFKWFFIFAALLIMLLIGIFLFIQTDTFDKIALDFALDKINTSLEKKDSRIYAESLTGNLFKGFTLNNGSIKVKDDTLLKFNSIQAEYSIMSLLKQEISVQNLILKEPQINLTNVKDKNDSLILNLSYLLEPEIPDTDTTSSPFDWGITAENLTIENGSVRILENKNSTLPIRDIIMTKLDTFDFGRTDISQLNLKLAAKYFPDEKDIDLKNLSFKTNSDFNVNRLTLLASINEKDTLTNIKGLDLLTDRSDFRINELKMNGFSPFAAEDYENFENNQTKLNIETQKFNISDLTYFIPEIKFLDSTIALKLIADGNYGNLHITELNLKLPDSKFNFEGYVKNLDNPSEIYFDIKGKDIEINPNDTRISLPGLPIPDYSNLGKVRIPYLTYIGEPERFKTDFDIRTSAGNADGYANFDLTGNEIRYSGDFSAANFNLGKIVKDKELESSINGRFKVDAYGFDYRTASGKLNYNLGRTKFLGQNISKSDGVLNFNRGNIGLNLSYNSEAVQTKLAGKINISNLKNISYDLKGSASNFNIAAFSKNNEQLSNLNFDFDINGRGFDPNNMTGVYNINLNNSVYAGYNIPSTPVELEIDQNGNIKNLSLKTDFAVVSMNGSFNFEKLATVINNNIEKVTSGISSQSVTDSTGFIQKENYTYSAICSDINFDYSIKINDIRPINAFTGIDSVNFKGNLTGSISDSCGIFNFISKGFIDELQIKDSLFITRDSPVDINIRNDISGSMLSGLDAKIVFSTNKLIVSKFKLDTTLLRIDFKDSKNNFLIWSEKDSTASVYTEGRMNDSMIFIFDTLSARYEKYSVTNNKPLEIKYLMKDSSQAIDFRKFSVNSVNQKLNLSGIYSFSDSSDIKLSASNIDLYAIQSYFDSDGDSTGFVKGKIRYFDLSYKGLPEYPKLEMSTVSEELSIGNTKLGRVDGNIKLENDDLTSNISFYNRKNTGSFSLTGNIPLIITLSDDQADSLSRREKYNKKPVNLNAVANNFQLKVFQQLLPYTENLEGILQGKISLLGIAEKPVLTGNMDVNSGKVYVTINKMKYGFFANMTTENEKLLVNNSRIFDPNDKGKFISASGYVDFTGLTLNDIKLEMTGDVKAFDKENGKTELGISGDLWAGSGKRKLTLRGNSDRFDLTGDLLLVKGNVEFNPFSQEAYNIYSDDFNYGLIIDSLKNDSTHIKKVLMQSPDSTIIIKNEKLNPFEKILYIDTHKDEIKIKPKEKAGKFFYDVKVVTSGNVFLKFIVNEKSQQEFFGEIITEDLNIYNNVNYTMMGRGTVSLGDNCYYKFFRKFDATGKTIFTGSISNPRLDINAQYKGFTSTGTTATGEQNLQDVIIDLKVTGEAVSPVLNISLQRNNNKETGSNATSDAISFLLFGKFSDQLSFSESSSFGASLGASYLSNYVSSSVEQIFPFLINTSFNYIENKDGNFAQNTDVRFTAAIGDAIVRFGGQIFKGLANTDIIVDYPINKLIKLNSISNNLIFRFERVYDPFYNDADITNTNGTRVGSLVYYVIKF